MKKERKQKVLVYVVQNNKLLVFKHLDFSHEEVGIQVPAGSVNPGESLENAALRELREETGFDSFELVKKLGEDTYDIAPYRDEIQERHFFLARPTVELPERWESKEQDDPSKQLIRFECFWIPLKTGHVLQSGQGALLNKLIPD